jgi:polyisoprenoid-binding protein YceI
MTITNGIIIFEASVPFFEPIKAKNKEANCILNTKRGSISFIAYIKDFRFERTLMEEHFNDNYMESRRYPKATFKGLIEKFDLKNISSDAKLYYIKGKITMHGKSKNIRVPAKIKKVSTGLELISDFTLNSDNYDIEVSYVVRSKISKIIKVRVKAIF